MKLNLYFLPLLLLSILSYSQDISIYQNKKKVKLPFSTNEIAFYSELSENDIKNLDKTFTSTRKISSQLTIVTISAPLNEDKFRKFFLKFIKTEKITYISPVFVNSNNEPVSYLSDQIIIKIKPIASIEKLKPILTSLNIAIIKQDDFDKRIYFIKPSKNTPLLTSDIANALYETGEVVYSEPDFLVTPIATSKSNSNGLHANHLTKSSIQPLGTANDPYFSQQWGLTKMQVPQAWDLTPGCSNIKVAVVDDGVEKNHPDLNDNVICGENVTFSFPNSISRTYTCSYINTNPSHPEFNATYSKYNAHGTFMAGIIAAKRNNNIGIAGVADCKILPAKGYDSNTISGRFQQIYYSSIGQRIRWSWQNGADVIVLGFTLGFVTPNYYASDSTFINTVLQEAIVYGRGGKGSIIIAPAGNDGTNAVGFPASNSNCIAVGATEQNDTRNPSSQYGNGLDVVAPGGTANIITTDLTGSMGRSTGDYITNDGSPSDELYDNSFGYTSAATAHVAGVAALILSYNQSLTQAQVRQVLQATAEKVGGYAYNYGSGEDGSISWNNQMGYGRVNAYSALQYVQSNYGSNAFPSNFSISLSLNGVAPYGAVDAVASVFPPDPTYTYHWYRDGFLIYTGSGYYQTLNGGDCGRQHSMQVGVKSGCSSTVSPLSNTVHYSWRCRFSKAYPNPAIDELTVEFSSTESLDALPDKIELIAEENSKIIQTIILKDAYNKKEFRDNKLYLNIKNLKRGTYYLKVYDPNQADDKKIETTRLYFK